jgi:hypothetical protein
MTSERRAEVARALVRMAQDLARAQRRIRVLERENATLRRGVARARATSHV